MTDHRRLDMAQTLAFHPLTAGSSLRMRPIPATSCYHFTLPLQEKMTSFSPFLTVSDSITTTSGKPTFQTPLASEEIALSGELRCGGNATTVVASSAEAATIDRTVIMMAPDGRPTPGS